MTASAEELGVVPDGPAAVVVRVAAIVEVAAVAVDITLTVSSRTKLTDKLGILAPQEAMCLTVSASVLIKRLARGLRGACVADPLLV